KTSWGFSCLISYGGKNILFDTGGSGPVLLSNMKKLNISPKDIDIVVLSHDHWDHIGGLFSLLAENSDVKVYVHSSFSKGFKKEIKYAGAVAANIADFKEIQKNIYCTGPMGKEVKEQALCIDTEKGLIVIAGCAHPGIVNMIKRCRNKLSRPVFLVMGGFHLFDESELIIRKVVADFKKLGVAKVAPCHCTGDRAIMLFNKTYGDDFIKAGAGKVIKTSEL
ncbi:MAG: MBL fold metallo-hydrolase, partial [bacterium]